MAFKSSMTKLSRRQLVAAGGLSLAGTALTPLFAWAQSKSHPNAPPNAARVTSGTDSVFTQCVPVGSKQDDGTQKYLKGDVARTFPIYALWMMLTTENWDDCFTEESHRGWQKGLFEELFAAYAAANPTADLDKDRKLLLEGDPKRNRLGLLKLLHTQVLNNLESFKTVRSTWDTFLNQAGTDFYGGRPCPGGGTILGVAGLTVKPRKPKKSHALGTKKKNRE